MIDTSTLILFGRPGDPALLAPTTPSSAPALAADVLRYTCHPSDFDGTAGPAIRPSGRSPHPDHEVGLTDDDRHPDAKSIAT
ncbi:MAG: hypothetical protein ACRCYR_09010 [Phycicoccus sp.]